MPRTAFTSSEWAEFCDGFDDPSDAWSVACHIWDRERHDDLNRVREFCTDETSRDLWEAAKALASTQSSIFHEVEERLYSYLWENSEAYRDELAYRRLVANERRYFGEY